MNMANILENSTMFENEVLRHFKETLTNIHKEFDAAHHSELKELSEYISKIYSILAKVINYSNQNLITDVQFADAMMLWRGTNTIIASFELVRNGYGIEPLVTLRNALETSCTAIDLFKNPTKYEAFKEKRYKSSNSIIEAKKIIPVIGKFYGMLSNSYSHVSFASLLPQYYKDETDTVVLTTGGVYVKENEWNLNINLSLISFILSIYLASVEYIFFKFCDKSTFWRQIDVNSIIFNLSKEEIEKNIKRIEKVLKALASLNKQ